MFERIRRDAAGYRALGGWYRNLGFWVGTTYRFGTWALALPRPLRYPLLAAHWFAKTAQSLLLHVDIPAGATIGPGLVLVHPFAVQLPREVVIGAGCTIFHDVTVGDGPVPGLPRIGDHVVLFVGARVLGGVSVGDRAEVGANAVVTHDVAAEMLVLSPLAKQIPQAVVRRVPAAAPTQATPAPSAPTAAAPATSCGKAVAAPATAAAPGT